MAWLTNLLDGSNLSGDAIARVLGAGGGGLSNIWDAPVPPGVGTGYTVGVVGKMNGAAGADPNHLAVIASGTDRVLTIRPGWIWVRRDSGSSSYDPRVLLIEHTSTDTVTISANASGTTRVDTVYLRVNIAGVPDATGSNIPTPGITVGGASSAVGNAPSDGALYVPLGNATVANGATTLSQANIADKRYVHPSQCALRMWRAAAGNTSTSLTAFAFDNKSWDFSGMGIAANGSLVAPNTGYYRGTVRASTTANTRLFAAITVAGVEVSRGSDGTSVNEGATAGATVFATQGQPVVAANWSGAASALEVGSAALYFDVEFLHW